MTRGRRYRRPIHPSQLLSIRVKNDLLWQIVKPVLVEAGRWIEWQVDSPEIVSVRSIESGVVRFSRLQDEVYRKCAVVLVELMYRIYSESQFLA